MRSSRVVLDQVGPAFEDERAVATRQAALTRHIPRPVITQRNHRTPHLTVSAEP